MPQLQHKQKIYCYIDETGQDTDGRFFLVVVAIVREHVEDLRRALDTIERNSGKHARKWTRATMRQREAYIRAILSDPTFSGALYYSVYQDSRAYVDLTILSTAKAINTHAHYPYVANIIVDGLQRTEQHRFGSGLRKLRIAVRKVRGADDKNDVLIRLADAMAGFIRDHADPQAPLHQLYANAVTGGRIVKL